MKLPKNRDMLEALRVLSKRLGKPVRKCNVWDPNVCDFRIVDHVTPIAEDGQPFSFELRFQHRARRISIRTNAEYICIEVHSASDFPVACFHQ